jgi:cell division protein ZapA (FtsZ GTPase activity inhibitor)
VEKRSVAITIAGQEYRIRSEADEVSLKKVAAHVDATMRTIREKTGTVDSLDVAVLTALNFAREILALREGREGGADRAVLDPKRLRALIELAEEAAASTGVAEARAVG